MQHSAGPETEVSLLLRPGIGASTSSCPTYRSRHMRRHGGPAAYLAPPPFSLGAMRNESLGPWAICAAVSKLTLPRRRRPKSAAVGLGSLGR